MLAIDCILFFVQGPRPLRSVSNGFSNVVAWNTVRVREPLLHPEDRQSTHHNDFARALPHSQGWLVGPEEDRPLAILADGEGSVIDYDEQDASLVAIKPSEVDAELTTRAGRRSAVAKARDDGKALVSGLDGVPILGWRRESDDLAGVFAAGRRFAREWCHTRRVVRGFAP